MNQGRTVFALVMEFIPHYQFQKAVDRYAGDKWVQSFFCWEQVLCMAFAQLTHRNILRDSIVSLNSQSSLLYHMGLRGPISKSTLSDANNHRAYRIYRDLAYYLIGVAKELYVGDRLGLDLENSNYAFDSTTIDLCLTLFPWAKFRQTKAGIKVHTLFDLQRSIPAFIEITAAIVHDINLLDQILVEPGSFLILDRGYIDFERLYHLTQNALYFVTRAKSNFKYRRLYSHVVDKSTGSIFDQTVVLTGYKSSQLYPAHLRLVKYCDKKTGRTFLFLSNNFDIPALTVAELYHQRWSIELFFKWIKQQLHIKSFFRLSDNAVKIQIWIAVSYIRSFIILALN